jgi:thiol-disulfide isomerase/thioredoxin
MRYFTLISLFFFINSYGQPINIGQSCPDVDLKNILNYKEDHLQLDHLKGKLVIIDFWSPNCIGCLKSFSKIDSLQKKFEGKMQVLLVNAQTLDSTKRFFAKMKKLKMPAVPFVTSDTLLARWFPHQLYPHTVWLDETGKVGAIAADYNLSEQNIMAFINKQPVKMNVKKDVLRYNWSKPLISLDDPSLLKSVEYYSYLMHGIEGLSGNVSFEKTNGSKVYNRVVVNRSSVARLFQVAYSERDKYDFSYDNRLFLEIKNTYPYVLPKQDSLLDKWSEMYSYAYDLQVPAEKATDLFKFMQQDMQRFFKLNAHIEKRKINCLVVRLKKELKTVADGPSVVKITDSLWTFRNVNLKDFLWRMQMLYKSNHPAEPFIDLTNYSGKIDINLATGNGDWSYIASELVKNGFVLTIEPYVMDVLVLQANKEGE